MLSSELTIQTSKELYFKLYTFHDLFISNKSHKSLIWRFRRLSLTGGQLDIKNFQVSVSAGV